MATIPSPDSFAWRHAQAAAQFYNANRASIEQADRIANQMAPTIRMIQQVAPTIAMVERMQRDMKMAGILTRQQAAFDAMVTTNRVPTEDELAETDDRLTELVPETDEEREQAAEIQADPQGKQLIEQITGRLAQAMDGVGDVVDRYKTGLGLAWLAWACSVLPPADIAKVGLYAALAAAWLAYRALPHK